jgi:LacI family transcriptional regulator
VAFAAGLAPELTTVRQPNYQLGRMAAELLLDEGRSGHQHTEAVFRPTLMIRDSTAAAG